MELNTDDKAAENSDDCPSVHALLLVLFFRVSSRFFCSSGEEIDKPSVSPSVLQDTRVPSAGRYQDSISSTFR